MSWITLTDYESTQGRKPQPESITIRAEAINTIRARKDYVTLSVGGHWWHVAESYDVVVEKLRRTGMLFP